MRPRFSHLVAVLAATLVGFPGVALAHGFGNRYALSLPRWMFIAGGAGVVVVSFGVVSVFAGRDSEPFSYTRERLATTPLSVLQSRYVVGAARIGAVVLLGVGVIAGVVGPQSYNANLLTNLVWVGWWIGYSFSVIFVANTWPVVNPWKTVYEWAVAALGRDPSLDREYRLRGWPVFVLFLAFVWLELIASFSRNPRAMVVAILLYSGYIWGGMLVYGKRQWLQRADPFTRLYDYLGRFAPFAVTEDDRPSELRMYGVALVERAPSLHAAGTLAFVVTVLYSVTFDGFLATPEWRELILAMPRLPVASLATTLLLLVGLGIFVTVYLAFGELMRLAAGSTLSGLYLARRFALSLLPIAIVYQVSHYYTFLLVQGQFLVLALSDPFGLGWDLLGVSSYQPAAQIPFVSVQFVWQSQVVLIVLGHIVAVWVAHHIALDVFETRREAIRSQVPMMLLMVLYTMLSLWILTRPVVDAPIL